MPAIPNLNRFAYFAAVAEAGSFTTAAQRLGVTKTVVSEQVRLLEADIRTTLLVRNTRRVSLTEAGLQFYQHCAQILKIADEASAEVDEANREPSGTLRIAAPNDFGAQQVAPAAAEYARRYPAAQVELHLDDERVDLIATQMDIAIRVGWLADSSLRTTRVADFHQMLVAAPTVLQDHPVDAPEDLESCPFVANTALRDPVTLLFTRNGGPDRRIRASARMAANSTPAVLAAALAGGGYAILPDFAVRDQIRAGNLRPALTDWNLPTGGIHIVYPNARYRPAKVTRFVDILLRLVRQAKGEAEADPASHGLQIT